MIDVIIPVYNGERFISQAINSALEQTWKKLNIIVVDDGSTDNSVAIVNDYVKQYSNIKLICKAHSGISATLNAGLANSTAPYVAFLDADDIWHAEKLEKQIQKLTTEYAEACFCLIQEFENFDETIAKPTFRARPQIMKGYSKTCLLTRRAIFDKIGIFDEAMPIDFVEWMSRAIRADIKVKMIEEVLTYRRVHNTNTSAGVKKNAFLDIIKTHIDKKRASAINTTSIGS
jgi:glycosyltransferase involved in cell wall biosynthesis